MVCSVSVPSSAPADRSTIPMARREAGVCAHHQPPRTRVLHQPSRQRSGSSSWPWLWMGWLVAVVGATAAPAQSPVPVIFDTDLGNDVDDVLAIGVIHALESRRECRLLAVTLTKDHRLAPRLADGLNHFYGRGEIPIGICSSGVTPEVGKYLPMIETRDGANWRYPHDLTEGSSPPSAVEVLRRTLAAAEDQSVVIVQVGFSTNLAQLLRSPADEISPLAGPALVKRKVKLLSLMAGAFRLIPDPQGKPVVHREYNVVKDLTAAQLLSRDWPTPRLWSGFEIGIALRFPHQRLATDFAYCHHHPLVEASVLYNPPNHNRPTWDLTSVLAAVRPDHAYFDTSAVGRVHIDEQGVSSFEETAEGLDRYLILQPEQQGRTLEALVQLASQPPQPAP